ncbi:MAG: hypothetical protein Q9187_000083 [Circinaria calcarea]
MDLQEGLVLEPLERSICDDSTQWPEFSLKNVRVLSEATGGFVSLLAAHQAFSVRVEGILEEIDPAYLALVKNSSYRSTPIILENVVTYSFSQFEDGTFGFWAAGKAGWFELRDPNKAYLKSYEEMKEATGMFYYLADKYRNIRKKYRNASAKISEELVKFLFHDYLISVDCQRASIDDVCEGFGQHREFLIRSMLEGQEDLDWEASPILQYFKWRFPDDCIAIKRVLQGSDLIDVNQELATSSKLANSTKRKTTPSSQVNAFSQSSSGNYMAATLLTDTSESREDVIEVKPNPRERKRTSILRPKGNKTCQKAAARRQSLRKMDQTKSFEGGTREYLGSPMEIDDDDAMSGQTVSTCSFLYSDAAVKSGRTFSPATGITKVRHADSVLPKYFEPRDHGDTWDCSFDKCNHKVWQARQPDSVEMMKQHFLIVHKGDAQHLIDQERRPWLSVRYVS